MLVKTRVGTSIKDLLRGCFSSCCHENLSTVYTWKSGGEQNSQTGRVEESQDAADALKLVPPWTGEGQL